MESGRDLGLPGCGSTGLWTSRAAAWPSACFASHPHLHLHLRDTLFAAAVLPVQLSAATGLLGAFGAAHPTACVCVLPQASSLLLFDYLIVNGNRMHGGPGQAEGLSRHA